MQLIAALSIALLGQHNTDPGFKDPGIGRGAIDPNYIHQQDKWPDKPFSSQIQMGRFQRTLATWHPCGCMDAPLAQGRIILPCKDHEKMMLKLVTVKPTFN